MANCKEVFEDAFIHVAHCDSHRAKSLNIKTLYIQVYIPQVWHIDRYYFKIASRKVFPTFRLFLSKCP